MGSHWSLGVEARQRGQQRTVSSEGGSVVSPAMEGREEDKDLDLAAGGDW